MNYLVLFSLLSVGAFLQMQVPSIELAGAAPWPFIPGLLLYFSLMRPTKEAYVAALYGGLVHDALNLMPMGYTALSYCIVVCVVSRFRDEVFIKDWITHVLFGAAVNVSLGVIQLFMLLQSVGLRMSISSFSLRCVSAVVTGGLLMPPVFILTDWLYRGLGIEGEGTV